VGAVRVTVALGARSYDVVIGPGVRGELSELVSGRAPNARLAAIVTTDNLVSQPWFDLDVGVMTELVIVPDGEAAKNLSVVESTCRHFARSGLSRRDVVVAVGGGSITDVAGFAAATYERGVAVVHVATTLLGQVDAAIGGKTGVNLPEGKNLVGAFHQPIGVLCDTETLATLPDAERRSGLGEIAKCWLLLRHPSSDLPGVSDEALVEMAAVFKARTVEGDEREQGRRALLNYGHTLAHALESQQSAGGSFQLRHGEAVAIGVAFAARLARRLGRIGDHAVAEHDAVLDFFALPKDLPTGVDRGALLAAMARDKKAHHNLTFVLADHDGFSVVADVPQEAVELELGLLEGQR
jgi:5-deoxy-5-amino-3-dehydroquinate synthase